MPKPGIQLDPTFVKVVAYDDNEYGYTCNMLRMVEHVSSNPGRVEAEHRFDPHSTLS